MGILSIVGLLCRPYARPELPTWSRSSSEWPMASNKVAPTPMDTPSAAQGKQGGGAPHGSPLPPPHGSPLEKLFESTGRLVARRPITGAHCCRRYCCCMCLPAAVMPPSDPTTGSPRTQWPRSRCSWCSASRADGPCSTPRSGRTSSGSPMGERRATAPLRLLVHP
jgi:hypothetical protein